MAKESVKDVDPISRFLGKALHRFGLGTRAKLIIISIIAKVIPLIILAAIAWNQFVVFGGAVQKMAVADAAEALNDSAVENIERMTTDTARNVADFLYERDDDIRYAATMKPGKSAYTKFINAVTSGIVETGSWALAEDGMSWVQTESMREQGEKASSTNEENLDKGGWHSRPAEGFTYRDVPIFDEITFVDTEGKEQVKVISENSTKKSYPMDSKRKDVSKRENTYVGSEDYWGELQKLRPGDIYVSDVKGVYVPSHFIGMYTPKQMVIAAVNGVVTALDAAEEKTDESEALKNALAKIKDEDIAKIVADTASNEAMMQSVIGASLALIDGAAGDVEGAALAEQVAALKEKVSGLTFDPGNEAYAGKENPLGRRFEGIVRWATPVTGEGGSITGYVTLALNHDHIMEFVDHQTPMAERYTDLPSAFDGNYAFIWDYNCRSICHPRHHSIYGSDPETGLEQIPLLETSLYEELLRRVGGEGLDDLKAAWPELVNAPEPSDASGIGLLLKDVPVFDDQSRKKTPAAPLAANGLVGLDGRYLNNAPQCTGWMDLTSGGGSGSFYLLSSGLHKLTTAAAIPYYTGRYAPSRENDWSKRGFAMVTIEAGLEDFTAPARETEENLSAVVDDNMNDTMMRLFIAAAILIVLAIFVAIWIANRITNRITNNITRLIVGKIEITKEKMDIVKVADTVSDIIRPQCDEKHILFEVKTDHFDTPTFMSDELRLRQVLINLLGNAVKFTPEHGKIHFTVENLGDEGDMTVVRFTVSDSGIGISDEAKAKIFKPFEQAASMTSRDYGGTGLGLAISSNIVGLMGGRIEVKSAVGEGSAFTFTIRMEKTSYSSAAYANYDDAIGKFRGKRVMIVDDIEVNRMVIADLLEETGVTIEEAVDGVEAVEKFGISPDGYYDIIFMDVQMPRMDGYAASSVIRAMQGREDAGKVVIVALTANAFTDDIERAKDSGMDTQVAKPVDADRLVEVMFEYLGEH